MSKKHKKLFQDIYDILAETKFKDEARREFRSFIKRKDYEWDGDKNIISFGKRFKIKLIS